MTEPKSPLDELTEEEKAWQLALSLNLELTRAKNDLEKALIDTNNYQALRRSVQEVHARLVATVKGYAQYLESEEQEEGEEDEEGQDHA